MRDYQLIVFTIDLFVKLKRYLLGFLVASSTLLLNSQAVFAEKFVLAAAENSIPPSYLENGEQKGILVDVINEVFKRIGHSVEIKLMPWARCQQEVKEGDVDGIFSIYNTEERQAFLTYADEILIDQAQTFFVAVESTITFNGNLEELAGLSLGIINDTSYGPKMDSALEKGFFEKIDITNSFQSNIRKLIAGRIDVLPSYKYVVLNTLKKWA